MRSIFDLPYRFFGVLALLGLLVGFSHQPAQAKGPKEKPSVRENLEKASRGDIRMSAQEIKNLKKQGDPLVRLRANQALVKTEGADSVDELLADVQTDPSALVRQGAAQNLGNYASQTRVSLVLRDRLFRETDSGVRYALARALTFADVRIAVPALERASRDQDPALRRQAASSLKRINNAEGKAVLKKLKNDPDETVRKAAND